MKFDKLKEGSNGWCKWQYPVLKDYKLACCDCGLVHTMQIEVIEQSTKETKRTGFKWRKPKNKSLRVRLRGKRNYKQTRILRKKDGITLEHGK